MREPGGLAGGVRLDAGARPRRDGAGEVPDHGPVDQPCRDPGARRGHRSGRAAGLPRHCGARAALAAAIALRERAGRAGPGGGPVRGQRRVHVRVVRAALFPARLGAGRRVHHALALAVPADRVAPMEGLRPEQPPDLRGPGHPDRAVAADAVRAIEHAAAVDGGAGPGLRVGVRRGHGGGRGVRRDARHQPAGPGRDHVRLPGRRLVALLVRGVRLHRVPRATARRARQRLLRELLGLRHVRRHVRERAGLRSLGVTHGLGLRPEPDARDRVVRVAAGLRLVRVQLPRGRVVGRVRRQ